MAGETAERARIAQEAYGQAPRLRASTLDPQIHARLVDLTARLRDAIGAVRATAARMEAPLRARVDAGATRAGELGEELRTLGAAEVSLRPEHDDAGAALTAAEVEIARVDAEATDARRRLEAAGEVEPALGDDPDELAARIARLEARRVTLGQVNPLAREEYEAEKERLTDLKTQREDLERSLEELDALCAELTATVERRFAETFRAVAEHFEEVASTLFPGGEGRLRLVEPEGSTSLSLPSPPGKSVEATSSKCSATALERLGEPALDRCRELGAERVELLEAALEVLALRLQVGEPLLLRLVLPRGRAVRLDPASPAALRDGRCAQQARPGRRPAPARPRLPPRACVWRRSPRRRHGRSRPPRP